MNYGNEFSLKGCNKEKKQLDINKKLRILYKKILCSVTLEDFIELFCVEVFELFNLDKIGIIEIDNGNYIFKKYISNKNNYNTHLTREIIYKEIVHIARNEYENSMLIRHDKDGKFSLWKKTELEDKFSVILTIEGQLNQLVYILPFLDEFLEVINSVYLKEFKLLYLERESYTDGLTKCYNRNYFELKMTEFKNKENLGIIVFDLDCLKDINDKFGHRFGDKIIKKAVDIIKSVITQDDIFCRYGGDEFVVLAINKTEDEVRSMMRDIKLEFKNSSKNNFPLNVSMGHYMKVNKDDSIRETFKMADYRMYKKKMKNKIRSVEEINKYINKNNSIKNDKL